MAEKEHQPSHGGDTEAAGSSREQRKKKRTKCFLYIVLFIIFQSGIIALFALTIMKYRTPKFRLHSAAITSLNAGTPASPSLRATITPDFSLKNTNFGRYKYQNTTVEFFYRGAKVGQVFIPNSKTGWRSTKRVVPSAVDLSISGSPELSSDLRTGFVPITTSAHLRGKVELMFIMKKNRATNLNCTMEIVTMTQIMSLRNIVCR